MNDNMQVSIITKQSGYNNDILKKHKYVVGCFRISLFQIRGVLGHLFKHIY